MARKKEWWEYLVDYIARPMTDWLTMGISEAGWQNYDKYRSGLDEGVEEIIKQVGDGTTSANDALQKFGELGTGVDPYTEQWINNKISQENTAADNAFQEHMRDTSYTSAGNQLQALGLSPSNVIQAGQASSGVSSSAATSSHNNIAMQKYAQEMAMAKQLLGMTSQMASAGIYGSALGAAKKASNILTSSASHSAIGALQHISRKKYDAMVKDLESMPSMYDSGPSDMSDWLVR